MTNTTLLENVISDAGTVKRWLAEQLGISRAALHNKICGKTEFTQSEIKAIKDIYNLTDEQIRLIFLN